MKRVFLVLLIAIALIALRQNVLWLLDTFTVEEIKASLIRSISLTLLAAIGVDILWWLSNVIGNPESKLPWVRKGFERFVFSSPDQVFGQILAFMIIALASLIIAKRAEPTFVGHVASVLIQSTFAALGFYITSLLLHRFKESLPADGAPLDTSSTDPNPVE